MPVSCFRTATGILFVGVWLLTLRGAFGQEASPAKSAEVSEGAAKPVSAEEEAFFESKIRPILAGKCFECHAGKPDDEKANKGGLQLSSQAVLLAGGDSGPAVVPGKPEESLLIEAISYSNESLQMPPRGKLTPDEIALLTEWVRRGAVFPATAASPGLPRKAGIDFTTGRQFWSFQPVREQPVPVVRNAEWPRQRIDSFVLQRLEGAGLQPGDAADRRTLLRRLSYDLTGLPPSPVEVEEFERDTAPDAYEQRVEQLLGSPAYGERWGRFWLDLVRYADTLEMWSQDRLAGAWRYRDWVVRAMNDDVPYDRFLQLQLAADQLGDSIPEDLAALGFLGLSPSYWKELKLDPAVIKTVVADEWEERIQMLSGTVLGLTVACARCHDHKQDPISTEDYYALAGILASTRVTPRAVLPEKDARIAEHVRLELEAWGKQRDQWKGQKPQTGELEQQIEELSARMAALEQATPQLAAPLVYGVEDAALQVLPDGPDRTKIEFRRGEAQNVALQIRGNPANVGKMVERRFLQVLSPDDQPKEFRRGSGRLELAEAFTRQGASLTARVIVNRVWKQHFGRGLVDTPSNFGSTGTPPTHPELLDDLAARFIASGWSLKWLHRELVNSATFRQASRVNSAAHSVDPDNQLLWRMNRRRLDVEAWRDSMLVATGRLRSELGGADRPLDDLQNFRRTLYGNIKRRELSPVLRLYDFPDPTQHSSHRDVTTTPIQQLFVLNGPLILDMAQGLGSRIVQGAPTDVEEQIRLAWQIVYLRLPSAQEQSRARAFLTEGPGNSSLEARWTQLAQALLGSNEFAFLD